MIILRWANNHRCINLRSHCNNISTILVLWLFRTKIQKKICPYGQAQLQRSAQLNVDLALFPLYQAMNAWYSFQFVLYLYGQWTPISTLFEAILSPATMTNFNKVCLVDMPINVVNMGICLKNQNGGKANNFFGSISGYQK